MDVDREKRDKLSSARRKLNEYKLNRAGKTVPAVSSKPADVPSFYQNQNTSVQSPQIFNPSAIDNNNVPSSVSLFTPLPTTTATTSTAPTYSDSQQYDFGVSTGSLFTQEENYSPVNFFLPQSPAVIPTPMKNAASENQDEAPLSDPFAGVETFASLAPTTTSDGDARADINSYDQQQFQDPSIANPFLVPVPADETSSPFAISTLSDGGDGAQVGTESIQSDPVLPLENKPNSRHQIEDFELIGHEIKLENSQLGGDASCISQEPIDSVPQTESEQRHQLEKLENLSSSENIRGGEVKVENEELMTSSSNPNDSVFSFSPSRDCDCEGQQQHQFDEESQVLIHNFSNEHEIKEEPVATSPNQSLLPLDFDPEQQQCQSENLQQSETLVSDLNGKVIQATETLMMTTQASQAVNEPTPSDYDIQQLQRQMEESERERAALLQELKQEKGRVEELSTTSQALRAQINSLSEENQRIVKNSTEVGVDLRAKLEEKSRQLEEMQKAAIILSQSKMDFASRLDHEEERVKELEKLLRERDDEIARLRFANSDLQEKLKQEQQKDAVIHQLHDQVRHYQVQTETLYRELEETKRKIRSQSTVHPQPVNSSEDQVRLQPEQPTVHETSSHECLHEHHNNDETGDDSEDGHHHHRHAGEESCRESAENVRTNSTIDAGSHDSCEAQKVLQSEDHLCHGHDHGSDHHHHHDQDHGSDHHHSESDNHGECGSHPHHDHADHEHGGSKSPGPQEPTDEVTELKKTLHRLQWENTSFRNELDILAVDAKQKRTYEDKCLALEEENVRLRKEVGQLEHVIIQLQGENDTIGDYITLYQSQKLALKECAKEKDAQLEQLAREREMLLHRLAELTALVQDLKDSKSEAGSQCADDQENMESSTTLPCKHNKHQIEGKIRNLLTEISSSALIENFHPCAVCSGRLMTV